MLRLRPLLATLFLLLAALAVAGQAVAGAAAGYSDCCLHGCDGLMHCSQTACQACAAPQAGPVPGAVAMLPDSAAPRPSTAGTTVSVLVPEPWRPPD